MFDEIVLETESGRVAGLVSSAGSKLKVVFRANEAPVEKTLGKSYQVIRFPSLTFLSRVIPDYLKELWASEPEYVLHLALEQLSPEKRTSREAGRLLRQGFEALDADSKKLMPLFKNLEELGIVKLLSVKPERKYKLLIAAKARVPVEYSWLHEVDSSLASPQDDVALDRAASDAYSKTQVSGSQISKAPRASDSKVSKSPTLSDYLAALMDSKTEKPEDFDNWVVSPFERAVEISTMSDSVKKLVLRRPRVSGYPLAVLLPSGTWNSSKENITKLKKIRSAALLTTIAANWQKDWGLLPHLDEIAALEFEPAKGTSPIELLMVIAALGRAEKVDSALANRVLEALLKDPKTDAAIKAEKKKQGAEQVGEIVSSAIACFPVGPSRDALIIKAVTTWGQAADQKLLIDYKVMDLLDFLERFDASLGGKIPARKHFSYAPLMKSVSEVVSNLLQRIGDELTLISVIKLQSNYVLEVEPELMAKFILRSFDNVDRLRPVSKYLSGMSQVGEIEEQRDQLNAQLAKQNSKIKHLTEDLEKLSVELRDLRKRSLSERKDQVRSEKVSKQEMATPTLRILARSLSAAHEFLADNEGAIGRFEILADQAEMSRIGASGEEVLFDPLFHNDLDNVAQPGDNVVIHNVGFKLETEKSETVLLKAIVVKK